MMNLKNLKTDFETNNMLEDLSPDDKASPTKLKRWEMRLKCYLDREDAFSENITKPFDIIFGQCLLALQSTIKDDNEYKRKAAKFDALWFFRKMKVITTRVDLKANPVLSFHEQILMFFTTRQGDTESNDDYLSHFNSRCQSMEMSRRSHFLCSLKLLGKEVHEAKRNTR